MFSVQHLTYRDALAVAELMRAEDSREITATRGPLLMPERVAMDCCRSCEEGGIGYVAYWGKSPVVAIGAHPVHPGVWSIYMFATDAISRIGLGLTRWVKNSLLPEIFAAGAHRIECNSIEGHDDAHAWMKTFGAKNEGAMPKFGIGQETFYRFALTGD